MSSRTEIINDMTMPRGGHRVVQHGTEGSLFGFKTKGTQFEGRSNRGKVVYTSRNIITQIGSVTLNRERAIKRAHDRAERRALRSNHS